ncbi:MAG: hypothetical protein ACO396_05915 [Phycisphaerales bacterium]
MRTLAALGGEGGIDPDRLGSALVEHSPTMPSSTTMEDEARPQRAVLDEKRLAAGAPPSRRQIDLANEQAAVDADALHRLPDGAGVAHLGQRGGRPLEMKECGKECAEGG